MANTKSPARYVADSIRNTPENWKWSREDSYGLDGELSHKTLPVTVKVIDCFSTTEWSVFFDVADERQDHMVRHDLPMGYWEALRVLNAVRNFFKNLDKQRKQAKESAEDRKDAAALEAAKSFPWSSL